MSKIIFKVIAVFLIQFFICMDAGAGRCISSFSAEGMLSPSLTISSHDFPRAFQNYFKYQASETINKDVSAGSKPMERLLRDVKQIFRKTGVALEDTEKCLEKYTQAQKKEILEAFLQAYEFSQEVCEKDKLVLYPGYFREFSESNIDVVRKAADIFGKVLIIVLPQDEEDILKNKVELMQQQLEGVVKDKTAVRVMGLKDALLIKDLAKICGSKVMVRRLRSVVPHEKLIKEAEYARKNYEEYGLSTYFILPDNEYLILDKELLSPFQKLFAQITGFPEERIDISSAEFKEFIKGFNKARRVVTEIPLSRDVVFYAGTFDPVTNGHLERIVQLAKDFRKVYVGIGKNPAKKQLFTTREREAMVKKAVESAGLANVEVVVYDELTVDCARRLGAGVLVRGARSVKDLKDELPLKYANELLDTDIPTMLVVPHQYADVSSTIVKEKLLKGEDFFDLVPADVRAMLERTNPALFFQNPKMDEKLCKEILKVNRGLDEHSRDIRIGAIKWLKEHERQLQRTTELKEKIDLHLHTFYSDGNYSPALTVFDAWSRGAQTISITDHDTLDGLYEAVLAAEILGMDMIPGAELSIKCMETEKVLHILTYFPNDGAEQFRVWLASSYVKNMREKIDKAKQDNDIFRRQSRDFKRINEELRKFGWEINAEEFKNKILKRPDLVTLAGVVIEKYNLDTTVDDFCRENLSNIAEKKTAFLPITFLNTVKTSGAVINWAHPLLTLKKSGGMEKVKEILKAYPGMFGCLEVYYTFNSRQETESLLQLCTEFNLIPTLGSDSHGYTGRELCRGRRSAEYPQGNLFGGSEISSAQMISRLKEKLNRFIRIDSALSGEKMVLEDYISALKSRLGSLSGKNILVKVSAGIYADQSVYLVRRLVDEGMNVRVISNDDAEKYIGKETFASLSRNPVITEDKPEQYQAVISDAEGIIVLNTEDKILRGSDPEMEKRLKVFRAKKIIIAISGGIAAYKTVELSRQLKKCGAEVRVAMTPSAGKFIGDAYFKAMGVEVLVDEFGLNDGLPSRHISWAEWPDLIILAPATVNTIAKLNHGIADNFLTTMLLSAEVPVLVAPAMETRMFKNERTQKNIRELKLTKNRDYHFIGPEKGMLASGQTGSGRMSEVSAIMGKAALILSRRQEGTLAENLKFILALMKGETPVFLENLKQKKWEDSAVMALLKKDKTGYSVLFTKRKEGMSYAEKWVLPGGGFQDSDGNLLNAGIRETREETNISVSREAVLGQLRSTFTEDFSCLIHPFLCPVPEQFVYQCNADEVADEEWISLEELFKDEILVRRGQENVVVEFPPATRKILEDIRRAVCEALALRIYGKDILEADEDLVDGLYTVLRSHPQFLSEILHLLEGEKDLNGLTVVVTAGPNQEKIPGREEYITNPSTGKQGFEIARAASLRGARVILITGPVDLETPLGVERVDTASNYEMRQAVLEHIAEADVYISAAAIADFKPTRIEEKSDGSFVLKLESNPDILREIGGLKKTKYPELTIVGFAAETRSGEELKQEAARKLAAKNLDMICGNDIRGERAGFGKDTNEIIMVTKDEILDFSGTKFEVGNEIMDRVRSIRSHNGKRFQNAAGRTELSAGISRRIEELKKQKKTDFPAVEGLRRKKIVVTAGATREFVDAVRCVCRQADTEIPFAIAESAILAPAEVIFISGMHLSAPKGARHITVKNAEEMAEQVKKYAQEADAVINLGQSPSVKPVEIVSTKIKKGDSVNIEWNLKKNLDVSQISFDKRKIVITWQDLKEMTGSKEEIAAKLLTRIRDNPSWYVDATNLTDSDNPGIVAMTKEIIRGAKDDEDKISKIRQFVENEDNFPYHFDSWETPASKTLKKRSGMCGNTANLIVAMCRAAGIPARLNMVFVKKEWLKDYLLQAYYHKVEPESRHCRPEFYLDGRWRELDDVPENMLVRDLPKEIYASMDEIVSTRKSQKTGLGDDGVFHYLNGLFLERLRKGEKLEFLRPSTEIIGLSGLVGSGKSTVSSIIELLGQDEVVIISMDEIGDRVREETGIKDKIIETFGREMLDADGKINRRRLGDVVFNFESARLCLNEIMYPRMRELALEEIEKAKRDNKKLIVIEAAILSELGLSEVCGEVWVIEIEDDLRTDRAKKFAESKIKAIEKIQKKSIEELKKNSGVKTVKNNGDVKELIKRVEELMRQLSRPKLWHGKKVLGVNPEGLTQGQSSRIFSETGAACVKPETPSEEILKKIKKDAVDVVLLGEKAALRENLCRSIRKLSPETFRVVFAEEADLTGKEMLKCYYNRLILEAESNLAVVKSIAENVSYLITPEFGVWKIKDEEEAINKVMELVKLRMRRTRLKHVSVAKSGAVTEGVLSYFSEWGQLLVNLGLAPEVKGGTYGNLSLRAEGDSFFVTAKGAHKGKLMTQDIVYIKGVDPEHGEIKYAGQREPSTEAVMHALIYQTRPDVGAIVHGHLTTAELERWKAALKITDKPFACGTLELAEEAEQLAGRNDMFLLDHHGFVSLSRTLEEAVNQVMEVENRLYAKVEDTGWDVFGRDFEEDRNQDYRTIFGEKGEEFYLKDKQSWLNNPHIKIFVLKYKGQVAGRALINIRNNVLEELSVRKEFRGRLLGRYFLNFLQERFEHLQAVVDKDFQLYPFLLSMGFKEKTVLEGDRTKVLLEPPEPEFTFNENVIAGFLFTPFRNREKTVMKVFEDAKMREYSRVEIVTGVIKTAKGLIALGIDKGESVGLISEERKEFVFTDLAVTALGAVIVPLFPSNSPEQVKYILNDAKVKTVIVSNKEQLEKVQKVRDELLYLKQVILMDKQDALLPGIMDMDLLWGKGSLICDTEFRKRLEAVKPEDIATITYTSGTTGNPKGVILTHANIINQVKGTAKKFPLNQDDVFLSYLPLAHMGGRAYFYYPLANDAVCGLPTGRDIDSILSNFQQLRPTVIFAVPSLVERLYRYVRQAVKEKGMEEQPYKAAEFVKDLFGGRLKYIHEGGYHLDAQIIRSFEQWGVTVLEAYGLTETSSGIIYNSPEERMIGAVGKPMQGVQVKIGAKNEVLIKGPVVMSGYLNKPEQTREALEEGWFHTGDMGRLDERGFLWITGRIKELLKTSGGSYIAPRPIEEAILRSPLVSQAHLIAEGRKYVVALIVPNVKELKEFTQIRGIPEEDIFSDEGVKEIYWNLIEGINKGLDDFEKIQRIALLPKPFTVESGELGELGKKNFKTIEHLRRKIIESLYSQKPMVRVVSEESVVAEKESESFGAYELVEQAI